MWRNWQTRQIQVLVGVKSLGGSTPLIRIGNQPRKGLILFVSANAWDSGSPGRAVLCRYPTERPMSMTPKVIQRHDSIIFQERT
jgi:hypothetical protein